MNKVIKRVFIAIAIFAGVLVIAFLGAIKYSEYKCKSKLPLVSHLNEYGESFRITEKKEEVPVVYMTEEISPESLQDIYNALGVKLEGKVGVKISTGETGSNYLRPELIGSLVQSLDGTFVECNTAYGGDRAESASHWQLIQDHGYMDVADCDIMDENGEISIPVHGGSWLKENYVGQNLENYDSILVLSHFKGHAMAGFGGAIKNISIGIASSQGKALIHSGGKIKNKTGALYYGDQDDFLPSMAEAGKSVVDYMDGKMVYINIMNRLSVSCDCETNPAKPDMHDIGILASTDPVALDQACVDLIYNAEDGQSVVNRIESRNGIRTLEHAQEIGLGSRTYYLEAIND